MANFNLKLLKQIQYNPHAKFETLEIKDMGNKHTWENINLATSKETLKFFRNIGSKQKVTREIKNGLTVIKIYSYEPNTNNTSRSVHVYTEIK